MLKEATQAKHLAELLSHRYRVVAHSCEPLISAAHVLFFLAAQRSTHTMGRESPCYLSLDAADPLTNDWSGTWGPIDAVPKSFTNWVRGLSAFHIYIRLLLCHIVGSFFFDQMYAELYIGQWRPQSVQLLRGPIARSCGMQTSLRI